MPNHLCINGQSVDYAPAPADLMFLRRVEAMLADPKVSALDLRSTIYGPENPVLAQEHGYTWVSAAAFASPVFRVLQDLHDRKRVATGRLNLEAAAARYTMTVAQAADQLGVGDDDVRAAVVAGRMPAWVKEGDTHLDPAMVAAYSAGRS
jgi:excisionase family DNA binding protein